MSQLIKKLKATQSQNIFVTSEDAAKIISFSGQKTQKHFRIFFIVILFIGLVIGAISFSDLKRRNSKGVSQINIPMASNVQISVKPLDLNSEEVLQDSTHYKECTQNTVNTFKDCYNKGACLYIKNLPDVIPSLNTFIGKSLDPYLKNCTKVVQQLKNTKKQAIVHKQASQNFEKKIVSLKDAIPVAEPTEMPHQKQVREDYDEQDDFVITAPKLTEVQQQHLEGIHAILNQLQIESVREDGSQSRLKVNGRIYHPNALISMKPRLTWVGIQHNELIFNDEYKQEYRKKISQN